MKKFLTLIAVAAMAFAAQAADLTVADGNAQGEYAPVYGYNFETSQHNQMQYPAAELAGLTTGAEITAMKFYTGTIDGVNNLGGSVKVSLANMEAATPWSVDGYGYISGNLLDVDVTTVAATVAPAADEDGVWTITFDAPFTYAGGALLVDVATVEAGSWVDTYFYGKATDAYYVMSTYGYAGSKKGQKILPKVTFTYEGGGSQEDGITTLSQANALEDNAEFTFNGDAVVTAFTTYQGISYLFLRDESGYGMVAGVEGTFANGQVLSQGWNATKTSVNDWVRFIDAAGLSASGETNDELAAAQKLTAAADVNESMINAFVCVENQSSMFPPRSYTLPDGSTIARTEILGGINWGGGKLNVYGIICKVDGTLKLNPLYTLPYVEPQPQGLRGDANNSDDVTIADVSTIIDYLLGGDATAINLDNADCNLQDGVTIADVSALIDYLLSGNW